eukprot:SAG31_NODE_16801_length_695_cov_0.958054_2_plen_54_part_01
MAVFTEAFINKPDIWTHRPLPPAGLPKVQGGAGRGIEGYDRTVLALQVSKCNFF